jgi:beta-lactamase class A
MVLISVGLIGCARSSQPASVTKTTASVARTESGDLKTTLQKLADGVQGEVGIAVIHVESGKSIDVNGTTRLPLYSVFKLPLAITVLKEVEAGQLKLDQKVQLSQNDVAPGSQYNTDLWKQPTQKTVSELIGYSIVRSDNTSSDKLLELVNGPAAVTQQMKSFGLANIEVIVNTREFAANRDKPNTGSTIDIARLIAQLQEGKLLQPANRDLLLDYMERSMTRGDKRLRANLPAGTRVADKTGTGDIATNDVGLITLPENRGHLAIAVLISKSKLPSEKQEAAIADIARATYDFFNQPSPPQ